MIDDRRVHGHKATDQLKANRAALAVNVDAADQLIETVGTHDPHSHAGILAMANKMDLGPDGAIRYGGHFDPAKVDAYRLELLQRVGILKPRCLNNYGHKCGCWATTAL